MKFYIVRVDAPPAVSAVTTTADGCFVTVESGPHPSLALALDALQNPKQRAYVLPDIVFLPTAATVFTLNKPVPASKPRLVVSAATVAQARGPQQSTPQQHSHNRQGNSHGRVVQRRTGEGSRDDGMVASPTSTAAAAAAAAARLPMTPVRWGGGNSGGTMQEGVGSPPALMEQHYLPQLPLQPGAQVLMGPPGTPQPQVPLHLAQAAAQVQAMLQRQLAQGQSGRVLLPLLQPMPLGLMLSTPVQQQQGLAAQTQQELVRQAGQQQQQPAASPTSPLPHPQEQQQAPAQAPSTSSPGTR